MVIDPKKGYHRWPSNVPEDVRKLRGREPKWTAHYDPCFKATVNASKAEKQAKKTLRAAISRVIEMIDSKSKRGYWTKEKCISKLADEFTGDVVLSAIRKLHKNGTLKKREGAYLIR